jgi:L-ascorbate metabolism protein UlaG (beta-lactamase superfamily)
MTKHILVMVPLFLIFATAGGFSRSGAEMDMNEKGLASPVADNEVSFIFLGYSGVIIKTPKGTILVDPAELLEAAELDALKSGGLGLVLFTHSHGDHFNANAAMEIFKATGAPVVAESSIARSLMARIPSSKLTNAVPGKTYTVGEFTVNAIKGIHIGPICLFQIKVGGLSIFHGGDSDYVPVKDYPSDLAFLPTGNPSPTASPEAAFKMAADLKPSVIVAIHGSAAESKEFERKIKEKMPNSSVIIPVPHAMKTLTLKKRS